MTREEARSLLGATRPEDERSANEGDDGDVRAAFALLRVDASLEAWYREECALDDAIASRLRLALPEPPASLRGQLIAGVATRTSAGGSPASGRRAPLRAWAAAAAVLLVVGGVGIALRDGWFSGDGNVVSTASPLIDNREPAFVSFRQSMSDYANGKIKLSVKNEDLTALTDWVSENSGPVFESLPEKMRTLSGIGCNVIDWDGRKVSLFCFRNTASGHVGHLFVIGREAFGDLPHETDLRKPEVCCGLESVAWHDDIRVYLLVAHEPEMPVSEFF